MTDRSTPEATLEHKLVALLAQCTEEEQSVFLAILEAAADEPDVQGFQAPVGVAVPSFNSPQLVSMGTVASGMRYNVVDTHYIKGDSYGPSDLFPTSRRPPRATRPGS